MAAVMLQVIPYSLEGIQETIFVFLQTQMEYPFCLNNYCIDRHYDNLCFLPKWRYHTKQRGENKELPKKLDAFCSNNQHTDCLYALLRHRFSGRMVAKTGQLCNNKQRAVRFNHQNKGVERMPSIVKKTIMRKKSKKNVELLPKD